MKKLGGSSGARVTVVPMWTEHQKQPQLPKPAPRRAESGEGPSVPEDLLLRFVLIWPVVSFPLQSLEITGGPDRSLPQRRGSVKKSPWPRDDACSRARPQSPRCQRRGSARPSPAFLPVASCPAALGPGASESRSPVPPAAYLNPASRRV